MFEWGSASITMSGIPPLRRSQKQQQGRYCTPKPAASLPCSKGHPSHRMNTFEARNLDTVSWSLPTALIGYGSQVPFVLPCISSFSTSLIRYSTGPPWTYMFL